MSDGVMKLEAVYLEPLERMDQHTDTALAAWDAVTALALAEWEASSVGEDWDEHFPSAEALAADLEAGDPALHAVAAFLDLTRRPEV